MKNADQIVRFMLSTGWSGLDADQFLERWEGVDDENAAATRFRKSLKAFREYLTSCAEVYKTAHEDAYNEANRLPKILYW
jgi:hypothetical protein